MKWAALCLVLVALAVLRWPRDLGETWATVVSAEMVAHVSGPALAVVTRLANGRAGSFDADIASWKDGPGRVICVRASTQFLSGELAIEPLPPVRCDGQARR